MEQIKRFTLYSNLTNSISLHLIANVTGQNERSHISACRGKGEAGGSGVGWAPAGGWIRSFVNPFLAYSTNTLVKKKRVAKIRYQITQAEQRACPQHPAKLRGRSSGGATEGK